MIPSELQSVADELDNWSRWGKERVARDAAPADIPEPTIWDAWLSRHGRVAGYGLTLAEQAAAARGEEVVAGEAPGEPPIDRELAATTDRKMRYLFDVYPAHYHTLHEYFVQWHWKSTSEGALHRALQLFAKLS